MLLVTWLFSWWEWWCDLLRPARQPRTNLLSRNTQEHRHMSTTWQKQQEIWANVHETCDSISLISYAGLSPVISAKIHSLGMRRSPKLQKKSQKTLFWGSRWFKVIDSGTIGKVISSACYDMEQVTPSALSSSLLPLPPSLIHLLMTNFNNPAWGCQLPQKVRAKANHQMVCAAFWANKALRVTAIILKLSVKHVSNL